MLGARHSVALIVIGSRTVQVAHHDHERDLEVRAPEEHERHGVARSQHDYLSVGSSLSRSQSPKRLIESVVSTITVAGASMIQGARVMYSRP